MSIIIITLYCNTTHTIPMATNTLFFIPITCRQQSTPHPTPDKSEKTHPICENTGGMLKGGISWAAESSGPARWGGCIICPSWGPSLMPPMAAEGWGCMPMWEGPATPGGSW